MAAPATIDRNDLSSVVDPSYSSGDYFDDTDRHSGDAVFKAENFLQLFDQFQEANNTPISSYADIGCGSGVATQIVAQGLRKRGGDQIVCKGFDVSPHVGTLEMPGLEFVQQDFYASGQYVDLVTLFDVFEHVPAPVDFLRCLSNNCKLVGLHIPLDCSFNVAFRDLYRRKLSDPGHLVFMDTASALNLLAMAGLRVVDYRYTFGFTAPSGHATLLGKLAYPVRWLATRTSPWLMSKTLGGASLMVLALTPTGLAEAKS